MGIVNGSYSKESSETIEIAPIPPNLFTDVSVGKSDSSTETNIRINDEHDKEFLNGFVLYCARKIIEPNNYLDEHTDSLSISLIS